MIFDQWKYPECKWYSFLWVISIMNPKADFQKIIDAINADPRWLLSNNKAAEFFISKGFIKNAKSMANWLALAYLGRWVPLITWINWVDWNSAKQEPYILSFIKDKVNPHSLVATFYDKKTWLIELQNSWWESFGKKWKCYVHIKDIAKLRDFYRIIV